MALACFQTSKVLSKTVGLDRARRLKLVTAGFRPMWGGSPVPMLFRASGLLVAVLEAFISF